MNILDKIAANTRLETHREQSLFPINHLEASPLFDRNCVSLANRLKQHECGIIAEHKRRSPSKPAINLNLPIADVVSGYDKASACGISVLTDSRFFGGSKDDLVQARALTGIPLLRKDFMLEEYQVLQAKAFGADVILLIAALLNPTEIKELAQLAKFIGMEILLEVHDEAELERSICPEITMVGVNNRNLKTFEQSLETSLSLSEKIPSEFVKVSESGITSPEEIKLLKANGFQGFLIGEHFMKTDNPGSELEQFINASV